MDGLDFLSFQRDRFTNRPSGGARDDHIVFPWGRGLKGILRVQNSDRASSERDRARIPRDFALLIRQNTESVLLWRGRDGVLPTTDRHGVLRRDRHVRRRGLIGARREALVHVAILPRALVIVVKPNRRVPVCPIHL